MSESKAVECYCVDKVAGWQSQSLQQRSCPQSLAMCSTLFLLLGCGDPPEDLMVGMLLSQ